MVEVTHSDHFEKIVGKISDKMLKTKVKKQIKKIIANPEIGKSMKNVRKGTREVYIPPFRLSYEYSKDENKIIFLDFYHKDEQ
ncbi:MAG TPA: type II toxin-antitoxin system RelE/ParE family toxin [Candidatus Nanoarchaeia archaeon]|nr:type II toxin-antitoxin system RelE/ParE family toxin [Candidatus Nanoarchaeia archaeon]